VGVEGSIRSDRQGDVEDAAVVVEHGSREQNLDQRSARRLPETPWTPPVPGQTAPHGSISRQSPTVVDQGANLDAVPQDVSSIACAHASLAASRSRRSGSCS
jgi:hypothetical protein